MHTQFPGKGRGVKHRLEFCPADHLIKIVREGLEVYPEGPEHGGKFPKGLLRDVPVRDVHGSKPLCPGKCTHIESILVPDGRLVVCPRDTAAPAGNCPGHSFIRIKIAEHRLLKGSPRDMPVLAMLAVEVAANAPERVGCGAGKVMEKRFLLDRVYRLGTDLPVCTGIQDPILVDTDPADSVLPLFDNTAVVAE